jgi:hypothetical protein
VTVTTPSGKLTSKVAFRVTPQIESFSPTSGPVGTVVTITGAGLTQTSKVTFGGVKATVFAVNSDTQVTATVPTVDETRWDEKAGLRRDAIRSQAQEIRPAMKKISTAGAEQTKNCQEQKLTIGLDLGDRSSWYCVLDEAG